ncbi:MAG: ComF family protein [Chloroflexi bacterium]|nr:ComF family protein [Chloroflexota bacterium]
MTSLLGPASRLLDLALPPVCAGCGREGHAICPRCLPSLGTRVDLPPGTPLGLADGPPDPLLQLEWCSPFAGSTRRALHALKYAGERRLATPLGAVVAERWGRAGAGGQLLVPVPVHAGRRRERGYDQAALIAEAAARHLGMPWREAVVRTRATAAQYRLDRNHRASNVADAFAVDPSARSSIDGRWVVLVDDVVTTGATLCATARALLDGGAGAVSAIAVARER